VPKFPEPPPPDLFRAAAPLSTVPSGSRLWRLYFQGGDHPARWSDFRWFGPVNARFDHHLPPPRVQERGVFYAAERGPTCIAEVYQATRVVDRSRASPALVAFTSRRPLTLLDVRSGATRLGASTAICSGSHARARRWAQAAYEALPGVDGILYGSSMAGHAAAYALFERAGDAFPEHPDLHRRLDDPALRDLVLNTAGDLGYTVV